MVQKKRSEPTINQQQNPRQQSPLQRQNHMILHIWMHHRPKPFRHFLHQQPQRFRNFTHRINRYNAHRISSNQPKDTKKTKNQKRRDFKRSNFFLLKRPNKNQPKTCPYQINHHIIKIIIIRTLRSQIKILIRLIQSTQNRRKTQRLKITHRQRIQQQRHHAILHKMNHLNIDNNQRLKNNHRQNRTQNQIKKRRLLIGFSQNITHHRNRIQPQAHQTNPQNQRIISIPRQAPKNINRQQTHPFVRQNHQQKIDYNDHNI